MKRFLTICALTLSLAGTGLAVTPAQVAAATTFACTYPADPSWPTMYITSNSKPGVSHYTSQGWKCEQVK